MSWSKSPASAQKREDFDEIVRAADRSSWSDITPEALRRRLRSRQRLCSRTADAARSNHFRARAPDCAARRSRCCGWPDR